MLYVGADDGTLHKFTGVFNGTPAEVVSGRGEHVARCGQDDFLTSPVFDSSTGKIFVGSTRSGSAAGTGMLHAVDSTIGSGSGGMTSSGQLFVNSMTGTFDAPIVDSSTGKVYVFVGDDFNNPGHSAIYQFETDTSLATQTSPNKATVSENNSTSTATTLWTGGFDDTYYSGAGDTGFLYVCGHTKANFNPTPVRVAMAGTFGGSVSIAANDLAGGSNDCSPVTTFGNNGTQYLFLSVSGGGNDPTCSGACAYMFNPYPDSTRRAVVDCQRRDPLHVGVDDDGVGHHRVERGDDTRCLRGGDVMGMTITQGANSPGGTTFTYVLRKNGGGHEHRVRDIGGEQHVQRYDAYRVLCAGDTIDVRVTRTSGANPLTTTFRVKLDPWTCRLQRQVCRAWRNRRHHHRQQPRRRRGRRSTIRRAQSWHRRPGEPSRLELNRGPRTSPPTKSVPSHATQCERNHEIAGL